MADEKEAAASSTAVIEPVEVEDLTSEQRDVWLKTGDRPAKEPAAKKEDSATSKPAVEADGKKAESGTADKNEKRWNELLRERKEEKQRADRLEAEIAELRKAAPKKEEAAAPGAPPKPKRSDFASDEEYEKAYEETYIPARDKFNANEGKLKTIRKKWDSVRKAGEELFGGAEWSKKIFDDPTLEMRQTIIDFIYEIDEDAVAAGLLNALNSADRKTLKELHSSSVKVINKRMDELEAEVRKELKREEKEPEKKAEKEKEPPKKEKEITAAGRPPREAGGTAATSGDEADAALQRGDGEAYRRIMNQRDIEKRKKARGR